MFPEALVGISTNGNTSTKIKALESKFFVSEKYGYDLPMVIVVDGKVEVWNPTLTEVKELLKKQKPNPVNLGFTVDKDGEIGLLNKNEVTAKEVKEFFTQQTKGDNKKTSLYMNKLLKLVNDRLKNDDLPIIDKLEDFIIHKEDIKNLVHVLDKDKEYKGKDLDKFSGLILESMQSQRPSKDKFPELADYKSVRKVLEEHQTIQQKSEQIGIDLKKTEKIKEFLDKVLPMQSSSISKPNRTISR